MISSNSRKAGPFAGNGTTTVFPFTFKVFSTNDLQVIRTDSTNTETVLTAGFTIALNSNQDTSPGGTVTLTTALATGTKLTILSNVQALQPVQITNGGGFFPSVINAALDRITIIAQQIMERANRSLAAPVSSVEPTNGLLLPSAAARAGKMLAFDVAGAIIPATPSPGTDAALRADFASNAGPLAGVKPERGAATTYRIDDAFQFGIRLTAFGYKGDGVTDDTAAWRAAIAFAGTRKIRTIIVPAGVSVVSGSIVNAANPLPTGMNFIGEAPVGTTYYQESQLKYTGTGVCWDIKYPTGGPSQQGSWGWDGITFLCSNPAGTMFDFGDTLNHTPADDPMVDTHQFLLHILFKNCRGFGAQGTGDFLRACKTFHINVDDTNSVYGFRRAFYLKGCDNCTISARIVGNNRGVQIESVNLLGNNNKILSHFIGGNDGVPFGGEFSYLVYDEGYRTIIGQNMLLESTCRAYLYLNGYGAVVFNPILSSPMPFFELGPNALETVITSPRMTVVTTACAPIIQPPAAWQFGTSQLGDYRVRIYDAASTIQAILPDHPRILQPGRVRTLNRNTADPLKPQLLGPNGPQEQSLICTAYNYWGSPDSPGGGGIKDMVQDATINNRWVMHLTKDTPVEQGIYLHFRVGEDIQPGVYKLLNRMRLASGTSDAGWVLIVLKNGGYLGGPYPIATSTSYTTISQTIDLTSLVPGDTFGIALYNQSSGATGVDLYVQAIGLQRVLDTGWTAGSGTASQAAFAAYAGQTMTASYVQATEQAQDDAIKAASQRVLAIEQALRRVGIIN